MNTTTLVESVLDRLHGVRAEGNQWKALCPAHADKNPSLSVREEAGKVLIHCFAGCSLKSVLDAAGIEPRELFADGAAYPRVVTEYDYTNETGELLYQVVRSEPKGFRQRRPDGKGGWIWTLRGVRRVLYRLPEVLAAQCVLVVEGEKDVETARGLGLAATCNAGGAGKWILEYSESLYGKCVHIVADADEPGRKHGQNVATALLGKVESLKVLELPGAKDLSEWVDHGGTKETLVELISNTPEWTRTEKMQDGFRLTSLRDLMSEPEEHISFVLADKLPAGGLSVLSAKPKVGKSTFARCLSLAVARGEPFLNCATTQGPVIYLALEEKRSEVRRHFQDLGATGEEPIYIHAASAPRDAVPELCALVKEAKPVLLVIDPLFKLVRVRDEKAYAEVCAAIEPLLNLARETGTHVLATHHNGKAEPRDAMDAILGSTAIFGGVDTAIVLKKSDRYRTVQSRQRYGSDWPELVLNFDTSERSLALGVEKFEAETERIGEAIVAYLSCSEEPRTRVQIEKHVKGKTEHLREALKALCDGGRVSKSGSGTRGEPLRYGRASLGNVAAENAQETMLVPCSYIHTGTREQESQSTAETRINSGDILVPTVSCESREEAESRAQEFEEGKL